MANSTWQTFQQTWEQRSQIAASEGIPTSAVKAVAANDYQRLLAGDYQMSNQDAYAAMDSVAQGKVLTPDPSATNNIATNAMNDVRGIMTGIFHMPETLWHDTQNVYQGVQAAEKGEGQGQLGSALNNVAQLLPGVTDFEQLSKGNWGYLEQHPVYAALDVSGIGDITRGVLATATGARSAAVDAAQVARQSAIDDGFEPGPFTVPVPDLSDTQKQITFQNILLSKHPLTELTKRAVKGQNTLNSTLTKALGPWGLYGNGELVRGRNIMQQLGAADYQRIASQLGEAATKLTPDDTRQFWQIAQSGRNWDDILADPNIPKNIKDALQGYEHMLDEYNKTVIDSGTHVVVTKPSDPTNQAVVSTTSRAAKTMRLYNTITDHYSKAINGVVAKQKEYLSYANKINGKYWDPAVESNIPGPLSADEFVKSVQQVITNKSPASMVFATGASRDSTRSATKRFTDLFAQDGPVDNLAKALASKDKMQINRAMSAVKTKITSKFYKNIPQVQQLDSFIKEYRDAQKYTLSPRVKATIAKSTADATKWGKRVVDINSMIDARWNDLTKDRYEEIIGGIMANKLSDIAHTLPVSEQQLNDVLDLLNSGNLYPTGIQMFVDGKQWSMIRKDAIANYDEMVQAGAKVFWIPKVKEGETAGMVRIGTDRLPSQRASFERATNFSYAIQNPYLGLAKVWNEFLSRKYTDQFYQQYVEPRLIPTKQIQKQAEDTWLAMKNSGINVPEYREYFAHTYEGQMQIFDPKEFLHADSRYIRPGADQYFINKTDLQLLRHMNKTTNNLGRTWDSSVNLFRHAVLTVSPRFAAHMTLGTAFLTLGKTGPSLFRYLGDAHTMITEGKFPAGMSRGTGFEGNILKDIYDPVKFHNVLGGRTLGRLWQESISRRLGLDKVSGAAHAWHHFLETWTDHYRVMAYLYGKAHADKKGAQLTETELSDAQRLGLAPNEYVGVKLANKVMADNLGRTPLENSIIRMVMPFGGWTHHVLRYVLQFPMDHPLRTNFLSNLGEQSYAADNTGLPEYLFHLLFLGQPDAAGNVNVIDFRQWNPLRDVANYMTLAGWVTQLNPLAQGILTSMGIDSATGTPELYPQLTYDSFYGGIQAQNPTGNTALSMLSSYIPEANLLDHFLKISNYTRGLAKYDPQAYKNQLWQSLNFPWMPQTINVNQIVARQETDRLNTMKGMVTSALTNNDPSYLNNLQGPFPYQGWYFSSDQIKSIIKAANQWSKETGVDVPASDLLQIPAAPSVPLSINAPVTLAPAQSA